VDPDRRLLSQPPMAKTTEVNLPAGAVTLAASMNVPPRSCGVAVLVSRSASARHGAVNRRLAQLLHEHGLATVLVDLLDDEEQWIDDLHPGRRFPTAALADRLATATSWLARHPALAGLELGYVARGAAVAIAEQAATRTADLPVIVRDDALSLEALAAAIAARLQAHTAPTDERALA
jgi:putative phosphoribosyl transferase